MPTTHGPRARSCFVPGLPTNLDFSLATLDALGVAAVCFPKGDHVVVNMINFLPNDPRRSTTSDARIAAPLEGELGGDEKSPENEMDTGE